MPPNAHTPRQRNRTGHFRLRSRVIAGEAGAIALDVASSRAEVRAIACEGGGEVLEGDLRYPSLTGNWQLGDIDLGEHLDR